MIRCHYCSAEFGEDSRFCPKCGQPTGIDFEIDTLTNNDQPDGPKSRVAKPASSESSASRHLNLSPGTILAGRYRILGILGRGGMGMVYKADDLKLGQVVALKFLPGSFSRDRERVDGFYAEVRIARQVSHPNVCRVYDVSELDGHHFLTMEYVDGEDLAALLGRIGQLPKAKALEVAHELCSGLAAAHAKNVIHRDLKPANVMIDGRGHARITDFGLAVGIGESSGGEVAGTPAYMAPELFDGKQASVQSDLYALGLILYELHTGKLPWEARSVSEWGQRHAEEEPLSPSSLVSDMDANVERMILLCLDKNPASRPRSAMQVAAALPGSSPLAAAIAAGETPPPEMVAAAGEEGSLSAGKAWGLLAAVAAGLVLVVFLTQHSMLANLLPPGKPPDVLSEEARQVAAKIGYADAPADSAYWFDLDPGYYRYSSRIAAPQRYRDMSSEFPYPQQFWYRQSPYPLRTTYPYAVTATNPVPYYSGEWRIGMDSAGRLNYFAAIAPQENNAIRSGIALDWQPLFAAADLNQQQSHEVEPSTLPDVPSDKNFAWETAAHGKTLRIQGASFRNKIVFFRVVAPWASPQRVQPSQADFVSRFGFAFFVAVVFALLAICFLFARKNVKQGRGDRQGAIRVAAMIFVVLFLGQALATHYTGDADWIFVWFLLLSGLALTNAVQFALLYVAMEPYVRRTWPEILISWSRLLAGRWNDPLVGRDVLIGVLFGVGMLIANFTRIALPDWFPVGVIAVGWQGGQSWREAPAFFGELASNILALMYAIGSLAVVFVVAKLTRSKATALAIAALFSVGPSLFGENIWIEVLVALVISILWLTCMMRVGLLSICVALFVVYVMSNGLVTFDLSRWYAWRGAVEFLIVLAIALYGFKVALGDNPLLGTALRD
jgi:serine/threonine-protein kinase